MTSDASCACGNAGTRSCPTCEASVCTLCLRTGESGPVCLACRSFELKKLEAREAGTPSDRLRRAMPRRVNRSLVFVPAGVVLALAAMTAVTVPILSQARGERHAEARLHSICEAELSFRRGAPGYGKLEELMKAHLIEPELVPDYDVRVELAKDGHTFWVRAVPRRGGLRGIVMDPRGQPVYETGSQ